MARYCPEKQGPALYLECQECESRMCQKEPEKFSEEAQIAMFGACEKCEHPLHPVPFIDRNDKGEIHMAVSYLTCDVCGFRASVDDSFDQKKWYPDTKEVRDKINEMIEYYLIRMH